LEDELKDTELKNAELTNAAEALAYGSIKYADLAQSRISDYVFSFDRVNFGIGRLFWPLYKDRVI
jgi:arginyl-tRNA synthetase